MGMKSKILEKEEKEEEEERKKMKEKDNYFIDTQQGLFFLS